MSCQIEQISDCGDISSISRALFVPTGEESWISQCSISISSCGNLLALAYKDRMCVLTSQWISSTSSNTFLVSWSGTLESRISAILVLPLCPTSQSTQDGPDWFCIIVGFYNGTVGFYTETGHLLLSEKFDEKPVMKISCHTGTYGILPDDVHIFYPNCECIVIGPSLFETLRNAKSVIARVEAGILNDFTVDSRNINVRKWIFCDQEVVNDATVVGLEIKNMYDHLLASSTYGGYDTWYQSVPPISTLILGAGVNPYLGFHSALEGGNTPQLQDVARVVANKIKSALPAWLGGGSGGVGGGAGGGPAESASSAAGPRVRSAPLSLRHALRDPARRGGAAAVSPDRRLAALVDNVGRVAVLDVHKGHLIRLFKGYRDAQCAFVQIFEQDKMKPKLHYIKEVRRAIFLIIYNPKKGLLDIRVMQSGYRIAVFTATKNGRLLYNTSGLVGAEKSYARKKLNLPQFQCVLMDPDGKLKTFRIPFHFALEGEDSNRSRDIHIILELRDYMKSIPVITNEHEEEILNRVATLTTMKLKKNCLEMLIRKYEVTPKLVLSCLQLFWDSIVETEVGEQEQYIRDYYLNLGRATLFYHRISKEATDETETLLAKINRVPQEEEEEEVTLETEHEFHLLEDDSCILERLLTLAQENDYNEYQPSKVSFADKKHTFKEFLSCFELLEKSDYLSLKIDTSLDDLKYMASDTFKLIFNLSDIKQLTKFIKESSLNPHELIKLIIIHIMNLSLNDISIELIEKCIQVLYYICRVTNDATSINYNEVSPWWEHIRNILVEMPCPLRSMVMAMACKSVSALFERDVSSDEEAWESVTAESANWGLLIGKLEDLSILSIIVMHKDIIFMGESIPKLTIDDFTINCKHIYTSGSSSITILIAKWLCSMGVPPEGIVANEIMLLQPEAEGAECGEESELTPDMRYCLSFSRIVDDNPKIFKLLSLLKQQFPYSASATYVVANMSWEYAVAWQNEPFRTEYIKAIVKCLDCLYQSNQALIKIGLFSMIWSTFINPVFEATCHLVNKVGKRPTQSLCLQDIGIDDENMLRFLEAVAIYLEKYVECFASKAIYRKEVIYFEKIWGESRVPTLIEVAQNTKNVNINALKVVYQICCVIFCLSSFDFKFSKPLDTLFDADARYIFKAVTDPNRKVHLETTNDKVKERRNLFMKQLILEALNKIEVTGEGIYRSYNRSNLIFWVKYIDTLPQLWNFEEDYVPRERFLASFYLGYDTLAIEQVDSINEIEKLLPHLIGMTYQRLKQSLTHSKNPLEWIAVVDANIYHRVRETKQDTKIPAHQSLEMTARVLDAVLRSIDAKAREASPAQLSMARRLHENCEAIRKRNLE